MSKINDFEVKNYNSLKFCDERERSPNDAPAGAFASVTLTSHDESEQWGEFMQREEALALYGWLGLMLSQP